MGESKLSAMTESKDFRSGTRTLLWEKDKLAMEYQDLQMKWTEIQQTKVSTYIINFRIKVDLNQNIKSTELTREHSLIT